LRISRTKIKVKIAYFARFGCFNGKSFSDLRNWLGRKTYIFYDSQEGAQRLAIMYALIGSCKINEINPEQWLDDILLSITDTKNRA